MIILGIAGGSGSGKTTFAEALSRSLQGNAVIITQDSYYLDRIDLTLEERAQINYDHPEAFETDLLISHLQQLRQGHSVDVPIYDYTIHARSSRTIRVAPHPIIIVEGILILENARLREEFDIKVYVDTDPDVRVLRRAVRDINERQRTLESVHEQYLATVKPMHEAFVEPSKKYADVIVPEGGHNIVALSLVVSRLQNYLLEHQQTAPEPSR